MKLKDMRRRQTKINLQNNLVGQIQSIYDEYRELLKGDDDSRKDKLYSSSITRDWGYVKLINLSKRYEWISEKLQALAEDFKELDKLDRSSSLSDLMDIDLKYDGYKTLDIDSID